jgi:hypothetical protein
MLLAVVVVAVIVLVAIAFAEVGDEVGQRNTPLFHSLAVAIVYRGKVLFQ